MVVFGCSCCCCRGPSKGALPLVKRQNAALPSSTDIEAQTPAPAQDPDTLPAYTPPAPVVQMPQPTHFQSGRTTGELSALPSSTPAKVCLMPCRPPLVADAISLSILAATTTELCSTSWFPSCQLPCSFHRVEHFGVVSSISQEPLDHSSPNFYIAFNPYSPSLHRLIATLSPLSPCQTPRIHPSLCSPKMLSSPDGSLMPRDT